MEKNFDINEIKNYILEYIRMNGPSLPTVISKKINKSLIITNAILSQMHEEKIINFTNLKIGSSPLCFLKGQEVEIEKFVNYLSQREREIVEKLKKEKVLEHEKLDSQTKVILNNLRDFAKPVKIRIGDEEKIFWKYFLYDNEEIETIIKEKLMKIPSLEDFTKVLEKELARELEIKERKLEEREEIEVMERKLGKPEVIEIKTEVKTGVIESLSPISQKRKEIEKPLLTLAKVEKVKTGKTETITEIEQTEKPKEKVKKKARKRGELVEYEEYLRKNFQEFRQVGEGTYEVYCDILNEKMKFLVVAKEKKKINEIDLILAIKEGEERKMPVIFLTKGVLTKKAKEIVSKSGSFLIVKNI